MGVFSAIALILIAAKAFGFLAIGWLWCFAPILVDAAIGTFVLGKGFFAAKKMCKDFNYEELKFGLPVSKHDGFDDQFRATFEKAKDKLG